MGTLKKAIMLLFFGILVSCQQDFIPEMDLGENTEFSTSRKKTEKRIVKASQIPNTQGFWVENGFAATFYNMGTKEVTLYFLNPDMLSGDLTRVVYPNQMCTVSGSGTDLLQVEITCFEGTSQVSIVCTTW